MKRVSEMTVAEMAAYQQEFATPEARVKMKKRALRSRPPKLVRKKG